MAQVDAVNELFALQFIPQRAFFNEYLRCFRCNADTATYVPAQKSNAPLGVTIRPVLNER